MAKKNFIKKHIKKNKKDSAEPVIDSLNREEFIRVLNWYSSSDYSEKIRKSWVIEYAQDAGMEYKSFKRVNENKFFPTFTVICRLANRGMDVSEHQEYISENFGILEQHIEEKTVEQESKKKPSIQDRIFEQTRSVIAEIDYFVDCKILNDEEKKLTDLLIVKNFSSLHTKHLLDFIQTYIDEYMSIGKGAEALKEIGMTKKQLKNMLLYLDVLKDECLNWQTSKKKTRKPRKKKIKTSEELSKLAKTSESSILEPSKIIKSSFALVYNEKYNNLVFLVSDKITGLSIHRTTVINFDEDKSKVYKIKKQYVESFVKKLSMTTGITAIKKLLKDNVVFKESKKMANGRLSTDSNIITAN